MKGLLATYLLSYGGALCGLFQPYIGFLAYVALSILKPVSLWYWSVPESPYSKVVAIGMLIGWVLCGFGSWNLRKGSYAAIALGTYWLWTLLGYFIAPNTAISYKYFDDITKIVLPAFVGLTTIDSVRKLKQLAWTLVCCEGYVALEMNLSYFVDGFNRLEELGFGEMDNNCNAICFVTCLGLALFLILRSPRWWQKGVALLFALMLAHGIFLAFSRGAMLALIATGLASFILFPNKNSKHYLFFVLALLVGLRMAGEEVRKRFSTTFAEDKDRDGSADMRLRHWKACLQSIDANPIFGVGPAHWPLVSPRYDLPPMQAHSLWLQVAAEQGLIGVSILALFYVCCAIRLLPITRQRYPVGDPWLHDGACMVLAALVGFVISAQFVSAQGIEVPYYVCVLGVGILKVVSQQDAARAASALPFRGTALAPAY